MPIEFSNEIHSQLQQKITTMCLFPYEERKSIQSLAMF